MRRLKLPAVIGFGSLAVASTDAVADKGGMSFRLPGTLGSLAATPQ